MQQWEYCDLYCDVETYQNSHSDSRGNLINSWDVWEIHCTITYYTESNDDFLVCNDRNTAVTNYNNLFSKAMRLLGEAGWELVSVQHGNENLVAFSSPYCTTTCTESKRHNNLLYDNKIAYFKRPKVQGRTFDVNEIKI